MNPLDKLLQKDEHREAVLRALGSAHTALDDAVVNYRLAFKAATSIGWSKADLTKAGFPDPTPTKPKRHEHIRPVLSPSVLFVHLHDARTANASAKPTKRHGKHAKIGQKERGA